jgi:hypothetical protein
VFAIAVNGSCPKQYGNSLQRPTRFKSILYFNLNCGLSINLSHLGIPTTVFRHML